MERHQQGVPASPPPNGAQHRSAALPDPQAESCSRRGTARSTHAPMATLPARGGSTNRAGRQYSARIQDSPSGWQSAADKYTEGKRSSASPPTSALARCRLPATNSPTNPQTWRGRGAPPRLSHGSGEPMGERRSPSTPQGLGEIPPSMGDRGDSPCTRRAQVLPTKPPTRPC